MGLFTKKEPLIKEEYTAPKPEPVQAPQAEVPAETESKQIVNTFCDEMGIIAGGTTIHGDIKTQGHIAIVGVVEGNIVAAGNVMLTGVVKGNIECNNIIIDGTDYNQCIKAKGSVSVKQNSTITGPIFCKHISISGTVIGNIKAQGNVGLTKDAVIKGDISSAILAVEPGAKITGNLIVK